MRKALVIFLGITGIAALALADMRFFFVPFLSPAPQRAEDTALSQPQALLSGAATSTKAALSATSSPRFTRLNLVHPAEEKEKHQIAVAPILPLPPVPAPLVSVQTPPAQPSPPPLFPSPATSTVAVSPQPPPLPSLNLDVIFAAVVKIECPSEDRKGRYVGSGFVLSGGVIVSAAHLIMVSGSDTCTIIFPNKDRAPSHYLIGTIREDRAAIRKRHDEEGIDVATLILPSLAEYPQARAIFPDAYPSIPYPVCENPDMIGDTLMHFGYPSNFFNQSYLSKADGEAIAYADIKGIETLLNQDQTDTYRSPIFSYVTDKYRLHPYMASRVSTFYGDSGGLAFNAAKQCILGPQRGGTVGGGAGENISIFPLLGWPAARALLP